MITRRSLLGGSRRGDDTGRIGLGRPATALRRKPTAEGALNLSPMLPDGTRAEAILDTLPGKKPLIKLSYRPPNYESPIEYLRTDITPNDAFFVRYHLSDIPRVDAKTWKLAIGGEGANEEVQLGLDDLKQLAPVEVVALCQCSGNRRGLFQPHVAGVEWGYGAMGCARWKGVRLKDLLDKAGLKKEAIEIVFDGADRGVSDKTPDFVKSIPMWKAIEDTTLVAYEMNGQPLPHWNGFPARIVVPGWTGTYWMKHVTSIKAVTKPFDGFWMKSAYRIPLGKFPIGGALHLAGDGGQYADHRDGGQLADHQPCRRRHGEGRRHRHRRRHRVGRRLWRAARWRSRPTAARPGRPPRSARTSARFALRTWSLHFAPKAPGKHVVMARATNKIGQSQATVLIPNPAGYHHNLVQAVTLVAA